MIGIGTRIADRYRLDAQLGAGGMGAVFRATDERLGRPVAVKVLLPELGDDAQAIARFEREARATANLTHPGIVQVHDFGATPVPGGRGRASYLVMELAEGETLASRIERGPMPPREVIELGIEVLAALATAHAAGVVHRDLKPENVMLARGADGRAHAKLLDFGLAQIKAGATYAKLTQTGTIMGTPRYMAPEQARGEPCDARTDVYAIGLVLYAALAGRVPFDAPTVAGIIAQVLDTTPPRLDSLGGGVPPLLAHAIETAIQKRPEQRFASARAFGAALEQARDAKPVEPRARAPDAYAPTAASPAISARPIVRAVAVVRAPAPRRGSSIATWVGMLALLLALAASIALVVIHPPLALPAALVPAPPSSHARASAAPIPAPEGADLRPECAMAMHCCGRVGATHEQCRRQAIGESTDGRGSALVCPIVVRSYHDVLVRMGEDASDCVWPPP